MTTPSFPRPPLYGAAAVIGLALLAATVGRLTGAANEQPVSTPITERDLRFEDRGDGAVVITDARTDRIVEIATGQNGFLRGVLRGFARSRRAEQIGDFAPFRLTAWADGRLTLVDPATGRHTDLEAFGPDNVKVFAAFLIPPIPPSASNVPIARSASNVSVGSALR